MGRNSSGMRSPSGSTRTCWGSSMARPISHSFIRLAALKNTTSTVMRAIKVGTRATTSPATTTTAAAMRTTRWRTDRTVGASEGGRVGSSTTGAGRDAPTGSGATAAGSGSGSGSGTTPRGRVSTTGAAAST